MTGNFLPTGLTEAEIAKAGEINLPAEPDAEEYKGAIFRTVFVNQSDEPWRIFDDRGMDLLQVPPKGESVLVAWDSAALFAPYSKVVYDKKGAISASRRHGFDDPADKFPYSLLLDNRDGSDSESIRVGDSFVEARRGIPRKVAMEIDDPLVVYKAVTWRRKTIKESIPGAKDYLRTRTIVEKRLVPRKVSEIRKIKKHLSDQAALQARKDAERRFRGVVGGPEMDDEATTSDIPTET